eukprot:RCo006146
MCVGREREGLSFVALVSRKGSLCCRVFLCGLRWRSHLLVGFRHCNPKAQVGTSAAGMCTPLEGKGAFVEGENFWFLLSFLRSLRRSVLQKGPEQKHLRPLASRSRAGVSQSWFGFWEAPSIPPLHSTPLLFLSNEAMITEQKIFVWRGILILVCVCVCARAV